MGDIYTNPPQSRNEAILRATIDGTEYTDPPQSRIEDLLLELKEAIEEGGGSVESYEQLTNKPQINGTTLSGDKSTEDLIPIDKGLEFDSDGKLAVSLGDGLAFNSDGEIDNLTEANPSDSATGELSKLKVGSVIYSVVTKAVNDLTNYYTKSEVYTKDEVNNIAQARFAVVAELPTQDIQTNVIYLVPKSTAQTNNDYDEYIYALKSTNPDTYGWEKIGDTEIDLSDYVTTQALNTALADYTTTTDLTTLLAGKQNTLTFDSTPTAQSTNPVTSGGIKTYVDGQGAKTASGNPITLTDAEAMNADHVVATITPTQTGSGTPSPSNVRPFVGFSSVDIDGCGKNRADVSFTDGSINGVTITYDGDNTFSFSGTATANGSKWFAVNIPMKANVQYVLRTEYVGDKYAACVIRVGTTDYRENSPFSYPENLTPAECGCYFWVANGYNYDGLKVKLMICEYTDDPTFEPYQGQTYTIQLGDTYYQGEIDLTSGVLRVLEKYKVIDGSYNWGNANNGYYLDQSESGLTDIKIATSTETHMACNIAQTNQPVWSVDCVGAEDGTLWFTDEGRRTYGGYQGFKTFLDETPMQIVYELATPIEIQLTPTQIALLENNNTITTNVSSLDITYQTNTAIGDTASALDKRATSLETKVPQPPTTDGTYKLTVTVASGTPTYSWESAT